MIEHPGDLRAAEVGREGKAGHVTKAVGPARHRGQTSARLLRAGVLPHDRRVHGLPRGGIPDDDGLALVGDAAGGQVSGLQAGFSESRLHDVHGVAPDLGGVVLDPPGTGVALRMLELRAGDHTGLVVDDEAAGARRALVDGRNEAARPRRNGARGVGHHASSPLTTVKTAPARASPMASFRAISWSTRRASSSPPARPTARAAERDDEGRRCDVGQAALGGERGEVDEDRVELERRDELAVLPGGAHGIQHDGGPPDAGGDVHEAARPTGDHGPAGTAQHPGPLAQHDRAEREDDREADDDHERRGWHVVRDPRAEAGSR